MPKPYHEFRDPIHGFVTMDTDERRVVDSWPFQRLRHIRQLAMSSYVYPGTAHSRFEHSLGVMELATRVYDRVLDANRIEHEAVRDVVPRIDRDRQYWKLVLRMAALCHDLGHLPFSHAAEARLLPEGWSHELLTFDIITSELMSPFWRALHVEAKDVAKIAVGPHHFSMRNPGANYSAWEGILTEIITGDAFGVDRMDYLLRDSHHAGVAYGRFDHHRLVDSVRILPRDDPGTGSKEPVLGVDEGGLRSAEALLLARYFTYSQVYFHPVRRIYDVHLVDFMDANLAGERFPVAVEAFTAITDHDIMADLLASARDQSRPGHQHAHRIVNRRHFRCLYQRSRADARMTLEPGRLIYEAAAGEFGGDSVKRDYYAQKSSGIEFPVLTSDERVVSSLSWSDHLESIPLLMLDSVYVDPDVYDRARHWLRTNRGRVLDAG